MKIFELSSFEWDGIQSWLYSHENKTEKQFKKDINFLLSKYSKEFLVEEFKDNEEETGEYIKFNDFLIFISEKFSELGYEKIETVRFGFDAGPIGKKYHGFLKKIIGEDDFKKIINHNNSLSIF